jgi:hypothetical protein
LGGWLLAVSLLWGGVVSADPWLAPGNSSLRSDVQFLADAGIVTTPVTSWPLSWADVVRDLDAVRAADLRTPNLLDAYDRVKREARRQTRVGVVGAHVEVAAAHEPSLLRGFEDMPREDGSIRAGVDWIGDRFAMRLQLQRVWSPPDGKSVRLDGSYLGMAVGNLMISAGYMEKWWGPGWGGSLILSSSARPIPSLTIERNYSRPFDLPVLSWLGPWRASFQAGRLESERGDFARPHFIALRVAFKPTPSLEVGVTRASQLCGEGRRCGLRTYAEMAIGRDNDQAPGRQPGNQLAGFDARYSLGRRGIPMAVYAQAIGEDEAGYLPSKYLGLGGVEAWNRFAGWSVRGHLEYARTSCDFARQRPELGCAYESAVYTDGYRFRGRPIGHAWDRDSSGWTAGAVAQRGPVTLAPRIYDVRLNRAAAGDTHGLAPSGGRLRGGELVMTTFARGTRWRVSLGYNRAEGRDLRVRSGVNAFVEWRREV